jgi:hypothetical protein
MKSSLLLKTVRNRDGLGICERCGDTCDSGCRRGVRVDKVV